MGATGWWAEILSFSVAASVQRIRAALTGSQAQPTGTAQPELQQPTASLSGAMAPRGTVAVETRSPLFTASLSMLGIANPSLMPATAALTGSQRQSGTAAAALRPATTALAGAQTQAGTMGAVLTEPVSVLTGTAGAAGAHYSDNFNRTDASTLGASWTAIEVGLGTEFRILSNTAAVSSAGIGLYGLDIVISEFNSALSTDNHKVAVTMAATEPDEVYLFLRSDGIDLVEADFVNGDIWVIQTLTGCSAPYLGDGTATARATTGAAQSFTASDVLSFEANGTTYTIKKNGTTILSWTDSGGAHTGYVNSAHRKVAMAIFASTSTSQAVDDFAADDL
jgi:hypothetical protein